MKERKMKRKQGKNNINKLTMILEKYLEYPEEDHKRFHVYLETREKKFLSK